MDGQRRRFPRALRRFTVAALMISAGSVSALASAPPAAACSGVVYPRVRYWCDVVSPLTAYTNNVLSAKHYNEMYEGGSLPVGIYLLTSGGSKLHAVNGTGLVYKTFVSATTRAYCWNRSSSLTSSARCDYIND